MCGSPGGAVGEAEMERPQSPPQQSRLCAPLLEGCARSWLTSYSMFRPFLGVGAGTGARGQGGLSQGLYSGQGRPRDSGQVKTLPQSRVSSNN